MRDLLFTCGSSLCRNLVGLRSPQKVPERPQEAPRWPFDTAAGNLRKHLGETVTASDTKADAPDRTVVADTKIQVPQGSPQALELERTPQLNQLPLAPEDLEVAEETVIRGRFTKHRLDRSESYDLLMFLLSRLASTNMVQIQVYTMFWYD